MKTDLPRPRPRRYGPVRVSLTAAVAALCGLVMAGEAAAQRGDVRLDRVQRRVQSLSPISGPPGTRVTLSAQSLPAITPMRIGMGTTRFGFEEVGQVMTNERGELSLEVFRSRVGASTTATTCSSSSTSTSLHSRSPTSST